MCLGGEGWVGASGFVLLTLPAFLPSVISSFFPKIERKGVGGGVLKGARSATG